MLIDLIILLCITILLFGSVVYSIQHRCPAENIRIDYVRAGRLPGTLPKTELESRQKIGISVINLKLDRTIPCGIYNTDTSFGNATLIVSKDSLKVGYLNYSQDILEENPETKKEIDKADLFDLWNITRITGKKNKFIDTYNRGCC